MSEIQSRVFVQEVSPRDGFQIEARWIDTDRKVAYINTLSRAGLAKIEVSSFVSPKAVPALKDAADVFAQIQRLPDVTYVALVPNLRGAERALTSRVDEINLVLSASETHNRANMNMEVRDSLREFGSIVRLVGSTGPKINGTIATAFGCPFEGAIAFERVLELVETFVTMGFNSITLADTTGMAQPNQVAAAAAQITHQFSVEATFHFHNTRGLGLANILSAYNHGVRRFDASLGGLGGCPFAPGATGNVCTEDVAHMFSAMSIETGVNLDELIGLSKTLPEIVGHDVPGQVAKAGPIWQLHPRNEMPGQSASE